MKKNLRIVFTLAMVLCLLLSIFTVQAHADAEPGFELTSTSGVVGDTVEVSLILHENPGITALSVQVGYSAADLELLSIDNAGLFSDRITTSKLSANPVSISWYASDSSDDTSSGTLAVLKFRIKEGAKNSTLTVTYDEDNVFNSNFDNVHFTTADGTVNICDESYILGDADDDGTVSIIDATLIQRHNIFMETGIDEAILMHGDVDGNGYLEIQDVTYIQRYLVYIRTPYPIGEMIG